MDEKVARQRVGHGHNPYGQLTLQTTDFWNLDWYGDWGQVTTATTMLPRLPSNSTSTDARSTGGRKRRKKAPARGAFCHGVTETETESKVPGEYPSTNAPVPIRK